jgi:hypothetical protein
MKVINRVNAIKLHLKYLSFHQHPYEKINFAQSQSGIEYNTIIKKKKN